MSRQQPFIFSQPQIAAIVREAAKLECKRGLRSSTFSTMFGLLGVAGLRISAAVAVDRCDVDLQIGLLTIRDTKFSKTRNLRRRGDGEGVAERTGLPAVLPQQWRYVTLPTRTGQSRKGRSCFLK